MHREVVRTFDDDRIGMMPAPMMAIAVVIKRFGAMAAMMEVAAVLIEDYRTMMMAMLGGDDDRICRGNRRRGNA